MGADPSCTCSVGSVPLRSCTSSSTARDESWPPVVILVVVFVFSGLSLVRGVDLQTFAVTLGAAVVVANEAARRLLKTTRRRTA
ncbi:hypothetical protein ACQPYE_36100 [Actinosynnema sp. CA-299493]